ncbi:MAG: hypothetical protein J0L51_09920 [Rhizobiales bacterium]|nr:hypothetical protein [Hyphomicrobiales bacterium]
MTNGTQQKSEQGRGVEAGVQKAADAMQQGIAAWMGVPQRLMQAHIETIGEGVNFMNRRMKAQAAMLNGFGQLMNGGNLADVQRHFIETMSREMADEAQEIGDFAHKSFEAMTRAAGGGGSGASSARMS